MAVAAALALLLAACEQGGSQDAAATLPGMTYASLQELPDLSGWWKMVEGPSTGQMFLNYKHLYQPEALAKLEATYTPGANIPDRGEYCRPARFVGTNGGALEDVEFLFTPGRLTITNESGLLRRIDLDGRPMRENPEESNAGTSVGHWEGRTLVIETVAVNSRALFPTPRPGHPAIGTDVRITERMTFTDQQEIEIESVVVAPQLLTAPLKVKRRYQRDQGHVVRDHDQCAEDDRTIDPETRLQRFDLTPPPDLPPPPPPPAS